VLNSKELKESVKSLAKKLIDNKIMIVTAESCTGGMIAQTLTDVAGSSAWFDRGFVTYSNESKQEMLGVSKQTLKINGAVSEATVIEMAEGALENSNALVSIACSGIAGPSGGTKDKPVGTVWLAWAYEGKQTKTELFLFEGSRQQIREQCTMTAIRNCKGS
jgi:nicotinamide-nucleotide amidase